MPITDHASARIMVVEDHSADRLMFRLCSNRLGHTDMDTDTGTPSPKLCLGAS
jgi:hypothetical protein